MSGNAKIIGYIPTVVEIQEKEIAERVVRLKEYNPGIKITDILNSEGKSIFMEAEEVTDNPALPKFLEERLK